MRITHVGFRTLISSVFTGLIATALLLGTATVSAQPIPDFLDAQSLTRQVDLRNSNLGRSALAIQDTCLALIPQPGLRPAGSAGEQLFARCGELVNTAADFNDDLTDPMAPPPARSLTYSDSNELLAAFQQVNGEEAQAASTMASSASNEQFSVIAARLGALRGATSTSVSSVAANGTEFMYGSGGGAAADDLPFGPWGWFIRGSYTTGERDPSNPSSFAGEEDGFDFDQQSLTIGIDHISGAAVWGIAVSASSYEVEMNNASAPSSTTQVVDGGKIEADSVNGSFFFDYNSQNDVYFSVLSGFGTQSFDMARNFIYFSENSDPTGNNVFDQNRRLIAAPDGDSVAASLTLGRIIQRGSIVIDPRIGFTYDRITIDQFAEVDSGNTIADMGVGAMNLAFAEQKIDSMRANIGIQFSNNVNTNFGSIRPTFSADWYHEFEDDPRAINAKYALEDDLAADTDGAAAGFRTGFTNCISCFSLVSEAPDSDYFVVGAGLAASYRNGIQAFMMLEGLLGYENLEAYSLTLGLRGHF